MEMKDTGKPADDNMKDDDGVSQELSKDNMSVRPKEYLVPPYAHRHSRETRKYDKRLAESHEPHTDERIQPRTNKRTDVQMKKLTHDSKSNYSRAQLSTYRSRGMETLANSAPRTSDSSRLQPIKYMDVPSRPLNKPFLEVLDKETPGVVAKVFHKRHDDFVKVMKRCGKDRQLINVLFSILAKLTNAKGENLIHLSSVLRESLFIENTAVNYLLSLIGMGIVNVDTVRNAISILRYIAEHSYTTITTFFGAFTVLFDLSQEIRASDLCTPDIKAELDDFDQIRSKTKTMRLRKRKKERTKEDNMLPPDSFRLINISPTADELLTNRAPFLRKNKDIGSYNDLEHYLDVQFRLLREDFVAPLRESLDEFKNNMQEVQDGTLKLQDIRLYSGVKITGTTTTYEGINYVLTFDATKTQKINWEFSKRLIYGSLLCLSNDGFNTIYFATVTNRDPSDLQKGMIEVQFTCEVETVRSICGEEFIMAESATYFESYKHILTTLQRISDLPFSQYIVECEDEIKPPAYLMRDEVAQYDLTMLDRDYIDETTDDEEVITDKKQLRGRKNPLLSRRTHDKTLENVDILHDSSWPSHSKLGMDESQHRALKNVLTHEFSITQGPPGTGKTFIGLKVARALLANKCRWSQGEAKQALLVVCFTNHALDQFLCGIHSFFKEGNIVRIGGRSASEEMKQHGIQTLFKYTTPEVRDALTAAYENANTTRDRINELKAQIYQLDRNIVKTVYLLKYMGEFNKTLEAGFKQQIRNINKQKNANHESDEFDLIREWLGHGTLSTKSDMHVRFVSNEQDKQKSVKGSHKLITYQEIEPINETSKGAIRQIWKIGFRKRWELYKSWVEELKTDLTETLEEYEDNFLRYCQDIKTATRDKHIEALRQADVIGMTTTGAAIHYEVLQSIKPRIVIVEEAAEVLEGHIVTSLSDECEHLILIGDHKQLRPSPTVYKLAKKYNLDLSLFERMINNKVKYESLEIQHRMRPEIADIIRLIYPYLKDHEMVLNKPDIRGVSRNVFFVTHQFAEDEDADTLSHLNKHEAEFIVGLCRYLLKQEYKPSEITVLTTYRAQMFYLQKLMPKDSEEFKGVNITVVDNYQGEENEIVLLSLVRSNEGKKVGFLKTENRINVALSRARNGMFVIGNMDNFADGSETWAKIVTLLQKEDQIGSAIPLFCRNHSDRKLCAQTMKDFDNAPEGGCSLNCEARLECGHRCELKCHVYDTDHEKYLCEKPCIRRCPNDHPCPKICHEGCGDCLISVIRTMPECGHEQTMSCFQDIHTWKCIAPCGKMCKNGHLCKQLCHEFCGMCLIPVVKTMPGCGHEQTMPCHQYPSGWNCRAPCKKKCNDGHPCEKLCHEYCGKCLIKVTKIMPKCGHEQTMLCFQDPSGWNCKAMCERKCRREHPCEKRCFEDCNRLCAVEVVKTLPRCGHKHAMACSMHRTNWKCQEDCERICKNGHKCGKRCYEDCRQCDVVVQRRLTKCGHDQMMPCYMDETKWNCKENCEKKCKNNHECQKLCSDVCDCTIEMTKEMPDCGHLQTIPCNVEPRYWKCKAPCDGKLECGHECPSLCSDKTTHHSQCAKNKLNVAEKNILLKLRLRYRLTSTLSLRSDRCDKYCDFILECGHKCPRKCYEQHETRCTKQVNVFIDKCGHSNEMPCYRRKMENVCLKPCEFILECGHKCKRKCYETHTKTCKEMVSKEKKCGHSYSVECLTDVESVKCYFKPCEYKLDCGHKCQRWCSNEHTKYCKVEVEKILPCCERKLSVECCENIAKVKCPFPCEEKLDCGHPCTNKCNTPHTSFCRVVVSKTLPCGHVKDLYCGVDIDTIKCTLHCKTVLSCGHGCKNTCDEPHTSECAEKVSYECNYGHSTTAPCHRIHSNQGAKCIHKCRTKLACGHTCRGTCFECRGGVFHKACSVCPLPDLQSHVSKQRSREGVPCLARCRNKCDHKECEKLCFEPCGEDSQVQWPCEEKCNAQCEHFDCKKRSFEQQKYEFCSDIYDMVESVAECMQKSRSAKRSPEVKKSHKSCGALVDTSIVKAAIKQQSNGRNRKCKSINEVTYAKIAGKLHEHEEKEKLKSKFYANHIKLHERLLSLQSKLETMNNTTDLYKIYNERLEYNHDNFSNWFHFQKQGYKDLEKEIERLERMARTILAEL